MKKALITIDVSCHDSLFVKGEGCSVNMVFFDGTASGCFEGKIIGGGVDTQLCENEKTLLSARYMLEGKDCEGKPCRVFIQNEGSDICDCTPQIITDSTALSFLCKEPLRSVVTPTDGGVVVRIYRR